ncbi:hypothetical protein AQUCO_00900355v1 [Aquilegia coerulea]|uniref:Phytocyanin domain-containing protein n=1 Tax=Aquilegia coerulea TaxID=218851 RepID=A0A2G5EDC9_AQUCA|nr:hypothetical protein AQUCO_00900355v1 [Aquilegia coerulea]
MKRLCATLTAKAIFIVLSSIMVSCVSGTNHTVGGATGWDLVSNMKNWTDTSVFYTGDSLEFKYGVQHDVLEVDQDAFSKCQISKPISTHNDGNTVITLDQPGTRYFICGRRDHCESGLKVQVDILPNNRRPRPPSSASQSRRPPPPKRHGSPDLDAPPTPDTRGPSQHSASPVQSHTASLLYSFIFIIIFFLWDLSTLHRV